MLFTEWNWDDAKAVWQEEARQEGEAKGRQEGEAKGRAEILSLVRQGLSADEIERTLGRVLA